MDKIIGNLKRNTKAYVSGVVAFISTYVVLFFFGIDIGADLQATIAAGGATVVSFVLTWAFPNIPAAPEVVPLTRFSEPVEYATAEASASDFKQTTGTAAEQWAPPDVPAATQSSPKLVD